MSQNLQHDAWSPSWLGWALFAVTALLLAFELGLHQLSKADVPWESFVHRQGGGSQQPPLPTTNAGLNVSELQELYLETVKGSVSGTLLRTPGLWPNLKPTSALVEVPYDAATRAAGLDWPLYGLTMVGTERLDFIQAAWRTMLERGIVGDHFECGTWRGGAAVFARAVFKAYGVNDRIVHVADSFAGLPHESRAEDAEHAWWAAEYLAVPLEEVRGAFARYGLLDEQVAFHPGFFRRSLPEERRVLASPIAFLRLDGDMYESTMDILFNLYDFVPLGGTVFVDDLMIAVCERAIRDFLALHDLHEELLTLNDGSGYWIKSAPCVLDADWYQAWNANRTDA